MTVDPKFKYEIKEQLAVLSKDGDNTVEANIIAYNDGRPKLDIRKWDRKENKLLKGITLTDNEAKALLDVLKKKYST